MKRDFLSLYDDCYEDIYRYIYFKTNSKWDTDDIVNDVFRRAFEKFDTVTSSPKSWLFTIARNLITDYYRKKKTVSIEENPKAYSYVDNRSDASDDLNIIRALRKSLNELSEDELEIVKLRYFSSMKYREIGVVVGKDEDYVKTKSSRIIKKLRTLVNKNLEE